MDKIEAILSRIPKFYERDTTSKMYGVLSAFASEFDIVGLDFIQRADNNIGIMDTDPRDLGWRWGNFLGVPRTINETDEEYRMRLVNTINSLHGGTADAIRYAVALILGIADDSERMERQIKIYDAWKYGSVPAENRTYGNFVIVVKFDGDDDFDDMYYDGIEDDIIDVVSGVKAAGTNGIVLFGCTANSFVSQFHHHQLQKFTHDDIRWRLTNKVVTHDDIDGLYDNNARILLDADGVYIFCDPPDPEDCLKDLRGTKLYDADNIQLFDVRKDGDT